MAEMSGMSYTAVILAGGQASRMGGNDKGLLPLWGRPLVEHCLQSLQQQRVPPTHIVISANRHLEHYQQYGWPVVSDSLPGFLGPLAGLLAVLEALPTECTVLMVPCDAVALPGELAQRLLAKLESTDTQVVSVQDGQQQWHPSILALRPDLVEGLRAYLQQGGRSIRGWLGGLRHEVVDFTCLFPNLNTPEALQAYELASTQP